MRFDLRRWLEIRFGDPLPPEPMSVSLPGKYRDLIREVAGTRGISAFVVRAWHVKNIRIVETDAGPLTEAEPARARDLLAVSA